MMSMKLKKNWNCSVNQGCCLQNGNLEIFQHYVMQGHKGQRILKLWLNFRKKHENVDLKLKDWRKEKKRLNNQKPYNQKGWILYTMLQLFFSVPTLFHR